MRWLSLATFVALSSGAAQAAPGAVLQQIVDIENHRLVGDQTLLLDLQDRNADVVARALLALGRIGDPQSVSTVETKLDDPRPKVRLQAAFALGILGGANAAAALTEAIPAETNPDVLGAELTALGRTGDAAAVATLATALTTTSQHGVIAAGAAEGLGLLWNRTAAPAAVPDGLFVALTQIATGDEPAATTAAFALTTFKGTQTMLPAAALLQAFAQAHGDGAKALLARTLGKLKTPEVANALTQAVATASLGVRVESVRSLSRQTPETATAGLRQALKDAEPQVVVEALTDIQALGDGAAPFADLIANLAATASERFRS